MSETIPNPPDNILEEANKIIYGDREKTYGAPDTNLKRIAALWDAYLRAKYGIGFSGPYSITPEDVCWMMVMLKSARQMNEPKRDNLVDAAGYVALIDRIYDAVEQPVRHAPVDVPKTYEEAFAQPGSWVKGAWVSVAGGPPQWVRNDEDSCCHK